MSARIKAGTDSRRWVIGIAVTAAAGLLLYLLSAVLAPFLFAMIVAYIFNPLVQYLVRWRLPRVLAVSVVFAALTVLAAAALVLLLPLIQREAAALAVKVPAYVDRFGQSVLPWLRSQFGGEIPVDLETLKRLLVSHWLDVSNFARATIVEIAKSGAGFGAWLLGLAIIPIVTFYMLLDWERLPPRILAVLPAPWRRHLRAIGSDTDRVLGSFLRGQLSVMGLLALIYSIGLWALGVELAFLIGTFAGAVSFVPYLGFLLGVAIASIVAYVQFQDVSMLLGVLAVFAVGQVLESFLLTPNLVGRQVGLHPLAVIFALMAGGELFGFAGLLLALPAAAAIKVWLAYVYEQSRDAGAAVRGSASRRARRA